MELRDYQQKLEQDVYEAWANGATNVLAQLSTGGGKTVIFSKILSDCQDPAIIIAHRMEIVSQISLTLARYGIRHSLIAQKPLIREIISLHLYELKRSYYDPQSRYIVAGVDTLIKMSPDTPWFSGIKLVIQDEAHHVLRGNKWGKAASLFPHAKGLYPTATPVRADGRGLGKTSDGIIDVMVRGLQMRDLIKAGHLSDYRIISPPNNLDLSAVPLSAGGDYSPLKLSTAVRKSHITGNVVEHYLKFAKDKLGVTFAVDINAATEIASAFREAGVAAEVISSKTPDLLRSKIMRRFRNRELLQLVNVDLLGEGVDVPAIEVVSMARPTQSYGLYSQQFGRALRPMPNKTHAIIIDHVNNVLRHGLPDDLRRVWSLERREKRSKSASLDAVLLKTCLSPLCYAVYERYYKCCPICGFYTPPLERSTPEQVEGDLMELDPETLAALRGEINRIDSAPTPPKHLDNIAQRAVVKRHEARQVAQNELRELIALYAGHYAARQCDDSQIYRRFYFDFDVDIATAQTLNAQNANELKTRIQIAIDDFVKNG